MSTDRELGKEDVVCVYNGILLSHKKNEIMPFVATWMDLKIITLSEVSCIEKDKCGIFKKWYKWSYLQNRNRANDVENKCGYQGERKEGG